MELLTKEDPHYSYSANYSGESPLFIATECRSLRIVDIVLQNCQSASHEGPDKKTALLAAIRSNDLDITRTVLLKKSDLTKATDNNGWTPLHYAAYYGYIDIVKELLKWDECAVFVSDKERQMTPLHLAAAQGYGNIMKEIISCRPDCCDMVDDRGWNFLDFVMAALDHAGLRAVLGSKWKINIMKNLLTAKEIKGNTPLQVYAVCQPYAFYRLMAMSNEVRRHAFNKENDSILSTCLYGSPNLQKEIKELKVVGKGPYRQGIVRSNNRWRTDFNTRMEKGRESQLVAAALVATVTFAAALTTPGGFSQEEGTSILSKKAALQAFIITDAIAMIFSLFAVFLHFVIAIDFNFWGHMFEYTIWSTIVAIGAMVIAFVTGTYAVLTPSLGLAIATTCIGLGFFGLLGWVIVQWFRLMP